MSQTMSQTITVAVTRVINATRDKAWRADTEPEYFAQWFGAKPGSVRADLRTGGTWSAVVTPGGEEIELEGRYVEVVEHRRVVMTVPNGPETLEVAVDFADLGDGRTEVTTSARVAAEAKEVVEQTAGAILAEVAKIAESL
jgi:uncharacterized protein YndB with AHSA1/START domain